MLGGLPSMEQGHGTGWPMVPASWCTSSCVSKVASQLAQLDSFCRFHWVHSVRLHCSGVMASVWSQWITADNSTSVTSSMKSSRAAWYWLKVRPSPDTNCKAQMWHACKDEVGRMVIKSRVAFRSKNKVNRKRVRILLQQLGNLSFDIKQRKDRDAIHRDSRSQDVGSGKCKDKDWGQGDGWRLCRHAISNKFPHNFAPKQNYW